MCFLQEGAGHQGSKASKVVFLGEKNRIFTTGFSRMSERQYGVWDAVSTTVLSKYIIVVYLQLYMKFPDVVITVSLIWTSILWMFTYLQSNLSKPLKMDTIDSSSGVMIPFYDRDTKVVFLAGKVS